MQLKFSTFLVTVIVAVEVFHILSNTHYDFPKYAELIMLSVRPSLRGDRSSHVKRIQTHQLSNSVIFYASRETMSKL